MAKIDDLRILLKELTDKQRRSVELSPSMTNLLMSAIEAQLNVATETASTLRFQVVLRNDDVEEPATVLGASSDVEVAPAMLQAAEKKNPQRKVRIFDRTATLAEVS
jgi:hypothetical protein